mgnify:FL=1
MKSKSFMEEVEEYCELLLECSKQDELSDELAKELIDKKIELQSFIKMNKKITRFKSEL